MKLIDLLLLNGSLVVGNKKVTPRFIIMILIIIMAIVLFLNKDKLVVDSYFTSVYWGGR